MVALGEPSWRINTDGGWDVVPVLLAVGTLLVLHLVFRVRIRWWVALAVILLAPLFRAFADRVGMPVAIAIGFVLMAMAVAAARRPGPSDGPRPNV